MIILGIDPGLSGALAFYDTERGDLEILDMPTLKAGTGGKRIIDIDTLAREIDCRTSYVSHAFVEQVGTRPGEGAVGAFSFGEGFGILKGIIAANFIPRTFARPAEWKKAMRVPAEKDGRKCHALPPQRKYLARQKRLVTTISMNASAPSYQKSIAEAMKTGDTEMRQIAACLRPIVARLSPSPR